jgi:Mitochondrial ribosomal protein mL59
MTESTSTPPNETPSASSRAESPTENDYPNPFLPYRNPSTNRWRAPQISLRRQADLVKLAQKHGVEPLLPPSRKSSVFKEARILEKGLRVRGTGEGQKVKGHKWERQMPAKLEKRRKAMEGMPEMVRLWKQVSLTLVLVVQWMRCLVLTMWTDWAWKGVEKVSEIICTTILVFLEQTTWFNVVRFLAEMNRARSSFLHIIC